MNYCTSLSTILLFFFTVVGNCLAEGFLEDAHLHPLEEFSITYAHEGTISGESTQQCRQWCNEMVTSEMLTTSMMGIKQNTNQKTNIVKEKTYNQNLVTGAVTVAENPMYQTMVNAWNEEPDPMAYAQRWMAVLGYQATGNKRTILNEVCEDYTSPQLMGSTACITKDGLTLRIEMSMGGLMNVVQTATELKRDDPGDLVNYELPQGAQSTQPTQVPNINIEQLQDMMKNLQVPSH